ncbi:MAG: triose-phosphate isomerase [bacterium]
MKPLIVANWKMNPASLADAKKLFNAVKSTRTIICPPFVYLSALKASGSQDCFWENSGAFTGEVSPKMLKDLGVEYVILGHSERRRYLGETNEMIDKKIKACLAAGLKPILCVEKPEQIKKWQDIIIAFEPVLAIGTGEPFDIQKAKKMRESLFGFPVVLYGGSVDSKNASDYIKKAGFQGLLVGTESLSAKEFIKIAKAVDSVD